MALTEQELRAMIRDAIVRHAGGAPAAVPQPAASTPATGALAHGSHGLFAVVSLGDECVIEPSRLCDHCGYCKSLGH